MDLKFRKTGNELAVLSIFVLICCLLAAALEFITEKRINPCPLAE